MVYVALLRGINVGGKNLIRMPELKASLETIGLEAVKTYINSGNVLFRNDKQDVTQLAHTIEKAILKDFNLTIPVIVRDANNIKKVANALQTSWKNDADHKCDVLFLQDNLNKPDVLDSLQTTKDIEDVVYVDGAIIWRVDRKNYFKSGMPKFAKSSNYLQVTIRNCNTARKLHQLMSEM